MTLSLSLSHRPRLCFPPHHRCARLWWDLCDVICPKSTFGRWFWCMGNCSGDMLRHVLHLKKCQEKAIWVQKNGYRRNFTKWFPESHLDIFTYMICIYAVWANYHHVTRRHPKKLILLHSPQFSLGMIPICPTPHDISFNTTYAAFSVANSFKSQNAAEPQNDGFQTGRFFRSLDIWDPEVVVLGVFFWIPFHTNK